MFSNINDFNWFIKLCSLALDSVAPNKTRIAPVENPSPWINDSIRCHRGECGKAECRWEKTNPPCPLLTYEGAILTMRNQLIKDARALFCSGLINNNMHNPRFLFKTINQLLNLLDFHSGLEISLLTTSMVSDLNLTLEFVTLNKLTARFCFQRSTLFPCRIS